MKKEKIWNIETHDSVAVSFYPTTNGTGGAFRETWKFMCKKGDYTNGKYLNACERRAKELKARSYRLFIAIPRAFSFDLEDEDY